MVIANYREGFSNLFNLELTIMTAVEMNPHSLQLSKIDFSNILYFSGHVYSGVAVTSTS